MTPGARGGHGYGRDDRNYPPPDPATDDPERAWRDAATRDAYPGYDEGQYQNGQYQNGYQNTQYPYGDDRSGQYYGGQQHGDQQYGGQGYQNYQGQAYGEPAYGQQAYGEQGYGQQAYGQQGYAGPEYGTDRYGAAPPDGHGYPPDQYPGQHPYQGSSYPPGHGGAGQTGYGEPGYGDPGYADPGYAEPGYADPGYDPRGYPPPYSASDYGAPAYGAAADDPSAYGRQSPELAGRGRAGVPPTSGAGGRGAGRPEPEEPEPEERRRGLPLWQELPLLLTIAFCLAILIRTFLLQAFFIPSGSMEDTLVAGDRVLVNKLVYNFREPQRGEVVVFRGTDAWAPLGDVEGEIGLLARTGRALGDLVGVSRPGEKDYIKRIIGLPGDRVSCCDVDGRIYVNGEPLNEEYVIRDSPLDAPAASQDCRGRRFEEIVIEPGQMFVLGDHRLVSQDSRCQGQVPVENIIGRAFVIVWPNDRWTGLDAPNTFDAVPPPSASALPEPIPMEPALLPVVLPVLLPVPATIGAIAARSGLSGHHRRRRLAE